MQTRFCRVDLKDDLAGGRSANPPISVAVLICIYFMIDPAASGVCVCVWRGGVAVGNHMIGRATMEKRR